MADDATPAEADSSPYQPAPTGNLFGCAISPNIVENAAELPSAQPFPHDCYTTLLHNPPDNQGLRSSDYSGKWSGGCYTKLLHNDRTHLVERRGGRIYYRRRYRQKLIISWRGI